MRAVIKEKSVLPKVLVVDDEPLLYQVVKKSLKGFDCELFYAGNGEEGLAVFHAHSPELIFLDLKMPVLDGFGFLKGIDHKPTDPYTVVVITGHGSDREIQKCYKMGIHAFLRKPVNMTEISSLAERCIRFKRMEQEREALVLRLQEALTTIKRLEDFLPICASCKKIRDKEGKWHEVESYIRAHTDVQFSHSICPCCVTRLYPGLSSREG